MINNPKNGWCTFQLGDFVGFPSYLTDVPVELLDAFLDYHEKGTGTAVFDEEGSFFTLLLTKYNNGIFVIEEKDETVLHDFSDMDVEELEKELLTDIKRDFLSWVNEFVVMEEDASQHKKDIAERISKLKKYDYTPKDGQIVKMIKLDDETYVPEDWCTVTNPVTSGGKSEVDDVEMLCGGDCSGDCSSCEVQRIMNEYAVLTGQD